MNRRFLIIASVVVSGGACIALLLTRYAESPNGLSAFSPPSAGSRGMQEVVPSSAPIDPSRQIRLAVGTLGLADDAQNGRLGDLITADLSGASGLQLVERQSLDAVLRETELSLSGLVRAKDVIRVGKLLWSDWFLLGNTVSVGGSNAIVARIVDTRTGIMRDAGVFPYEPSTSQLADKVASFVRQCRQAASGFKPHEYLGIGAFKDLSVNSRQADFPTKLRAHLMAAYQGSGITILEREYVDELLKEARLDLAGLTEETGTNPPIPMQSAFWLVTGYYQSYERSNIEVELNLRIERIFGWGTNIVIRDSPSEPVFKKIKNAIDEAMNKNVAVLVPTRTSEVWAQMDIGRELAGGVNSEYLGLDYEPTLDDQQRALRKRNLEEAIRAFETVLLLEPTNLEARMYMAGCLRSFPLNRFEEARQYYREVLEAPGSNKWETKAQRCLLWSFAESGADEKARWYKTASEQTANSRAVEFYRTEADKAARDVTIRSGDGSKIQELAEARLFETLRAFDRGSFYQSEMGMGAFAETFGTNRAAAAQRLVELLPKMKAQAANSIPYLLATLVTFQVDTNAPVIAEFERTLEWCSDHPRQVPNKVSTFWNHLRGVYDWSSERKAYELGVKILEAKTRAMVNDPNAFPSDDNEDKIKLAYAYMAMKRWQDALRVFGSYSNSPVFLGNSGPWGPAFTVLRTSKAANYCRKQLGLSELIDPRELNLENTGLCFCRTSDYSTGSALLLNEFGAFVVNDTGVWIAHGGRLTALDFNLHTNFLVNLPLDPAMAITAICPSTTSLWIGTGGAGLIEFDKASQRCQLLTEKDGLMMGFISSLCISGDSLWIGYGQQSSGGLGRLELPTHHVTSFMSSLSEVPANRIKPPRTPITSLAAGISDDLWLVTDASLKRYRIRDDVWEEFADFRCCTTVVASPEQLFAGVGPYGTVKTGKGLGVDMRALKAGSWRSFGALDGFPSKQVSTLTVDGQNLWVGGMGYVACVDPVRDTLLRFAYVKARVVDRIQVGGGYVWAQFDWHLWKAPLNTVK